MDAARSGLVFYRLDGENPRLADLPRHVKVKAAAVAPSPLAPFAVFN